MEGTSSQLIDKKKRTKKQSKRSTTAIVHLPSQNKDQLLDPRRAPPQQKAPQLRLQHLWATHKPTP